MDEQFIRKTYRSVVIAWAIAMVWALALQKPWVALSITLGMVLGTAVLATYDLVIRRAFVPGAARASRALVKLALVKYPLIGLALYALVRWDKVSLPAFCGGILLVHLAMFAKLAGIVMVERREAGKASPAASRPLTGGKET